MISSVAAASVVSGESSFKTSASGAAFAVVFFGATGFLIVIVFRAVVFFSGRLRFAGAFFAAAGFFGAAAFDVEAFVVFFTKGLCLETDFFAVEAEVFAAAFFVGRPCVAADVFTLDVADVFALDAAAFFGEVFVPPVLFGFFSASFFADAIISILSALSPSVSIKLCLILFYIREKSLDSCFVVNIGKENLSVGEEARFFRVKRRFIGTSCRIFRVYSENIKYIFL
ncbi:MAG: hypothetical protein IJU05_08535 [Schwartzia sp.]|nr:hypothetical protein [Schwartzia sp. (in: firmicutes)]